MKVYTLRNNGILYTEEVPTNNTSSGAIAGLPPDEPPMRKKKKKFRIDIFQRIKNARLKEQTMEDQQVILEKEDSSNSEVGAAMRFIQQKRKLAKRQEREKRAQNRKQEIQTLSKAKAKDYQKKAGERQKQIAKDINKSQKDQKDIKNSFDWQGAFTALNEQFATLSEEQQEKFLYAWLEMTEENQDKFTDMISENFERATTFVEMI
jgi:hypothetical protein